MLCIAQEIKSLFDNNFVWCVTYKNTECCASETNTIL